MNLNDSIVYPLKGKNSPKIGPVALMISAKPDIDLLISMIGIDIDRSSDLYLGKLYAENNLEEDFSIAGPMIGAPYAVMVLETLIAWGAMKILFYGWCGAVSDKVKIGDIIIPTGSMIDEGTSKHYSDSWSLPRCQNTDNHNEECHFSNPSELIVNKIRSVLRERNVAYHEGIIWSTDAIYRETPEKVAYFQSKGVLAVEMETSALFTVGKYRDVDVGAILVASDDLSALTWKTGFKDNDFKQSRKAACDAIGILCRRL